MSDEVLDELEDVDAPPAAVNVQRHAGGPLAPEADLFVPPPPVIGKLVSAETSLVTSKHPMSAGARWLLIGGLMFGVYFGLVSLARMANLAVDGFIEFASALLGLLAGVIAGVMTRFSHRCSYVGELGVARYRIKGSRSASPREELFLFGQARNLKSAETDQYYNGVYTGTSYDYRWTDGDDRLVFRLNGSYRSKKRTPKPRDPYHFAKMAEIAWSVYLLQAAQAELQTKGYVEFVVNKRDVVRVGPGFMEFCFKGKTERVPVSEMKDISINQGWFSFKTNEARMFSSKGKFSFQYGQMGNAKLFLMCLDRLAGIRWS
jgi:hypothetical protein